MKPFGNSENFGALISMCPQEDDVDKKKNMNKNSNYMYSREFQAMLDSLDEEDSTEESRLGTEKKRRLSMEQVKALEKSFEVDNKLEPERKLKLAQELGLQPRQVAIWFQNRRARWKTKQLERDYGLLKANYDALQDFGNLEQEKEALTEELRELKGKLGEENAEGDQCEKEESVEPNGKKEGKNVCFQLEDRSSHADNSNYGSSQLDTSFLHLTGISSSSSSSSHWTMNWFQANSDSNKPSYYNPSRFYQSQVGVKLEEQSMFVSDSSCNLFSVEEQAPSMHWYLPHHQQRTEF